jgi:hypothetical protein
MPIFWMPTPTGGFQPTDQYLWSPYTSTNTASTTAATTAYYNCYWIDSGTVTASAYNHLILPTTWRAYTPAEAIPLNAPALLTHQEAARRDEELYRHALAECNEQEAARILRLIQLREQEAAERRVREEAARQREDEARAARHAALERANELLLEHLTPQQRDSFHKNGWFIVEGGKSKTKYRIHKRSAAGNIDVLERNLLSMMTDDGRVAHRLCCHVPYERGLPIGDHLLAQKMMLQYSEDDFLRIANRH